MRKFSKKVTAGIMAAVLMASTIAGFGQTAVSKVNAQTNEAVSGQVAADSKIDVNTVSKKAPKYIFLFIGDGMSYPQVQSASRQQRPRADPRDLSRL